MVTKANQSPEVVKVEKRQSVAEALKAPPFYPELPKADNDEFKAVPIVVFDAWVVDWTGGKFGDSQFTLFKYALLNSDNTIGEPKVGMIGGVGINDQFKKLLRLHKLPSMVGLTAVIALQTSEATGHPYWTFSPF